MRDTLQPKLHDPDMLGRPPFKVGDRVSQIELLERYMLGRTGLVLGARVYIVDQCRFQNGEWWIKATPEDGRDESSKYDQFDGWWQAGIFRKVSGKPKSNVPESGEKRVEEGNRQPYKPDDFVLYSKEVWKVDKCYSREGKWYFDIIHSKTNQILKEVEIDDGVSRYFGVLS